MKSIVQSINEAKITKLGDIKDVESASGFSDLVALLKASKHTSNPEEWNERRELGLRFKYDGSEWSVIHNKQEEETWMESSDGFSADGDDSVKKIAERMLAGKDIG